ncbi:hypothetical protein GCM10007301_14820 [Azorhizobium oxalatiphilum]|uniref:Uncharacterized protein n=1 Tax=Azorhizobium oxalatiphilum TaxID=980631 RepID=A0A917BTY9_9HYPH|nr:hypothetical protein GCM10007301_14820 [Azorhizobium oxalatiphilum]
MEFCREQARVTKKDAGPNGPYPLGDDEADWDRVERAGPSVALRIGLLLTGSLVLCAVYFWFASSTH